VDTIAMDDGTTVDVTITDMTNPCVFFNAAQFGIGVTGLELPNPDGSLTGPPGMEKRLAELRLKASHLMGWTSMTAEQSLNSTMPFAVSITAPADYTSMTGSTVKAADVDLVARWYASDGHIGMHTAAPGSGSTCLGAAVAVPGTIPNQALAQGPLKSGKGGDLTFGHPSGEFTLHTEPNLDNDPNKISYRHSPSPGRRASSATAPSTSRKTAGSTSSGRKRTSTRPRCSSCSATPSASRSSASVGGPATPLRPAPTRPQGSAKGRLSWHRGIPDICFDPTTEVETATCPTPYHRDRDQNLFVVAVVMDVAHRCLPICEVACGMGVRRRGRGSGPAAVPAQHPRRDPHNNQAHDGSAVVFGAEGSEWD
jgi:hypothetical protein